MKLKLYILTVLFALLFSCDGKFMIVNCNDCTESEPSTANILLKLNPTGGSSAIINVFKGPVEDDILLETISTNATEYSYSGTLNTRYSFTAEYYFQDTQSTVVVVNSAYPRVKYEKQQCENNCYYVYDNTVNLKVKYH
ncbi:MAG TPA: hypothetical protein VMT63_07065 [Bacteroidales bacterium]|nr:hypothetical protein [Bacteroidales bacterium]